MGNGPLVCCMTQEERIFQIITEDDNNYKTIKRARIHNPIEISFDLEQCILVQKYIRRFIEQGTDLDKYSKEDIYLMMNHINNTKREKLNDDTPYNLMKEKIGEENIKKLGFYFIPTKDIILKPSLFNKDNNK